jgi:hypothetical protein
MPTEQQPMCPSVGSDREIGVGQTWLDPLGNRWIVRSCGISDIEADADTPGRDGGPPFRCTFRRAEFGRMKRV